MHVLGFFFLLPDRIHIFHEYQGLNLSVTREQVSEHIINNDIEANRPQANKRPPDHWHDLCRPH